MVEKDRGGILMKTDNFSVKQLDNGVPVLMVSYPDGETVSLGISFGVGGRNEWEDKSLDGISHFLEHQFFKGNDNLSPADVNRALDTLGGIDNAFTTEDATCYFVKCLNTEIYNAIDLWGEFLTYGKIDQTEFDKESFVVRQEFRRFEDSPASRLYFDLKKTLFQGTSLEMDVIGTEKSLETVTLEQMERYRAAHYGFENAVLMLLGNYDKAKVFDKLNQTFGNRPVRSQRPTYKLSQYTVPTQTKVRRIIREKDTPLIFFGLAIRTPGARSNDYYALELLDAYLSLGRSSPLHKRLVRSGLTSFAEIFTQTFEDMGLLVFLAGGPEEIYEKAHNEVFRMLHHALTDPVDEKILEDLCQRLEYSKLAGEEDPINVLLNQATEYWQKGYFESFESYLDKVKSVSVEEFDTLRKQILQDLDAVYGITGKTELRFEFPENTWKGRFEDTDIPSW